MFENNYYKTLPQFKLTAPFGEPRYYGYNTFHCGDDYASKKGKKQDIFNVIAGVVIHCNKKDDSYHGKYITLKHNFKFIGGVDGLFFSRYKHLHKIDDGINENDFIPAGYAIGKMGNTGYCKTFDKHLGQWRFLTEAEKNDIKCKRGVHLHLEFSQNIKKQSKLLKMLKKLKIITGLNLDYFFRRGRLFIKPDAIFEYAKTLIV